MPNPGPGPQLPPTPPPSRPRSLIAREERAPPRLRRRRAPQRSGGTMSRRSRVVKAAIEATESEAKAGPVTFRSPRDPAPPITPLTTLDSSSSSGSHHAYTQEVSGRQFKGKREGQAQASGPAAGPAAAEEPGSRQLPARGSTEARAGSSRPRPTSRVLKASLSHFPRRLLQQLSSE
uniref:Uncharacterized protein n=1 Tax=Rangifer tarandus platyrhynchus TaxID=3082113 RepID=A0ACB0F3R8_RANTA|nr:unnamed protein product [Rangifer tarandus platyrhynchus]